MMKKKSSDVVIVGAGPAGSFAAEELARNGADVLVLEKKPEIGPPKRCAEGVSLRGLNDVGIKPEEEWAVAHIKGARLYPPSETNIVDISGEGFEGYVLERKIFEKWLASKAINQGAQYMVKTQALGFTRTQGICRVKAQTHGEPFTIETKLVIGADGVETKVGRWAGIKCLNRASDYHSGFQYEMAAVDIDQSLIHIFFGTTIAPKGYAWVFPKKFSANVGLGILTQELNKKRPREYLHDFIDTHPQFFKRASPIEVNAGGVPVGHSTGLATDNVLLVGDAAQVVHPLHGGGINRSLRSARAAARVALSALDEKNYSHKKLVEYEEWWEDVFSERIKKLLKVRLFLEKLEDKDYEILADVLNGEEVMDVVDAKYRFLLKKLVTKPSMARLIKKYLGG